MSTLQEKKLVKLGFQPVHAEKLVAAGHYTPAKIKALSKTAIEKVIGKGKSTQLPSRFKP